MKFYIFKDNKILTMITIMLIIIFIINQKQVLCEENVVSEEETLIELLKQIFGEELYKYVRQEDFEAIFSSLFYENVILQENFIKNFIEHLDLKKLLALHDDKSTRYIKEEVLNQFHNYIQQKQILYQKEYVKNTFSHMIGNLIKLLEQHMQLNSLDVGIDAVIKTPGFLANIEIERYKKTQDFIKESIVLKIDFDPDKVVFTLSCYGICFIRKEFF